MSFFMSAPYWFAALTLKKLAQNGTIHSTRTLKQDNENFGNLLSSNVDMHSPCISVFSHV
jgi:hypothetical protein